MNSFIIHLGHQHSTPHHYKSQNIKETKLRCIYSTNIKQKAYISPDNTVYPSTKYSSNNVINQLFASTFRHYSHSTHKQGLRSGWFQSKPTGVAFQGHIQFNHTRQHLLREMLKVYLAIKNSVCKVTEVQKYSILEIYGH